MSDRLGFLLWIAVPYAAFAVFVTGHFWRYRRDQLGWSARSTQLLERRLLRIGSLLFHIGMLSVLAGHVVGILVPSSWTRGLAISDGMYHVMSATGGMLFGTAMLAGFAVLIYRRRVTPRVAATTTRTDVLTYVVLGVAIVTGMLATTGWNVLGHGYEYRETVAPWFRGLGLLSPDPAYMSGAPLLFQVHALSTVALFALWPFSRLVHAWSVPIVYLVRSPILYRRRLTRRRVAGGAAAYVRDRYIDPPEPRAP
jgi:nitrate reductase gamma subunit